MNGLKSIVFDLDGTLVDSKASIIQAVTYSLELNQINPCTPITFDLIGPPIRELFKTVTKGENQHTIDKLVASFVDIYDSNGFYATTPYPGIRELLEEIQSLGVDIYLATNKRLFPTSKILERLDWNNFFNGIYAIDSVSGGYKNKCEMISALILNHSIESNFSVYIGDRIEDYIAATANNISAIVVGWGYESDLVMNNYSGIKVSTVDELSQKIKQLM